MREQKTGCTFGARDDTRSAKNAPDLALCGSGPRPCSARQPRLWGPIELGDRGPDEDLGRDGRASPALPGRHRGRRRCPPAQPQPGQRPGQADPGPCGLPPGTPVAFEAAYGWAGWSTCWRNWSWSRTWSIPAAARPSPRPGARTTRSMRPPWPSCSGLICCPRPGSPPAGPGSAGPAVSPGRPGLHGHRRQEPGACGAGRPWHRRGPGLVDWSWAGLAGKPGPAADPAGIIQDGGGLLDALATPSPGGNARSPPWPSPTHGSRRCWPSLCERPIQGFRCPSEWLRNRC
jgi:hypothetical protein